MTGFEIPEDEYHLFFEDEQYAGLEVVMSGMGVGEALHFDVVRFRKAPTVEDAEKDVTEVMKIVAEHLLSWNATRKGVPVPATQEGLLSLGSKFVNALIGAWVNAMTGVPAPLALGSSDTGSSSNATSETVPSIPMEPLSNPPSNP